jgi:hypothetical protein
MDSDDALLLVLGVVGAGALLYFGGGLLMSGSTPWTSLANWSTWASTLSAAEQANGLPAGLLSAVAYRESGFQTNVINGTQASSADALGIMQLEPAYFSSVQVPVPFTSADVVAQIGQGAQDLASLYQQFGNWPDALAAYNAGASVVQAVIAGTGALPAETQTYVADITGWMPSLAAGGAGAAAAAPAVAAAPATGGTGATGSTGGTGATGSTSA